MAKIITVKVSKGGTGKTTIVSNLAHSLANMGKKVLMIDLDSQANLSTVFLRDFDDNKLTSSNLLGDDELNVEDLIYEIEENLHLIVADIGLYEVMRYLEGLGSYHTRLNDVIKHSPLGRYYDYIFIDMSPGVADSLTDMALVASDLLISPMLYDRLSLEGLSSTMDHVSGLVNREVLKETVPDVLIVPNRHDLRFRNSNKEIMDVVERYMDKENMGTPIRENSHIRHAMQVGQTAIAYELAPENSKKHKKAVEDFDNLAKLIIKRLN